MELLKIENKQGFLCLNNKEKLVSQITAEDISSALELILSDDKTVIPEDADCSAIDNPAQKIIFEQLLASFKEVFASRAALIDEIDEAFIQAETKYLRQKASNHTQWPPITRVSQCPSSVWLTVSYPVISRRTSLWCPDPSPAFI